MPGEERPAKKQQWMRFTKDGAKTTVSEWRKQDVHAEEEGHEQDVVESVIRNTDPTHFDTR